MKSHRAYSRVTRRALATLGKMIRVRRVEHGMTAQELAERAGISRTTLYQIEKGAPGPQIGSVFEVATILGIPLFHDDPQMRAMHEARLDEKLTLLPRTVRPSTKEVDDD